MKPLLKREGRIVLNFNVWAILSPPTLPAMMNQWAIFGIPLGIISIEWLAFDH
jgi:hypothetical protein